MPFLNGLAAKYAVAASYYANSHPSISNYFVLTTGQAIYKGRFGDVRTDHVDVDNVIRQLKQNGKTWRSYAEGVPGPGYMGGNIDSTGYVKRHNPLAYFAKDIADNERANLAPFSQFSDDLAENRLPNYSFIVPQSFRRRSQRKRYQWPQPGRCPLRRPHRAKTGRRLAEKYLQSATR